MVDECLSISEARNFNDHLMRGITVIASTHRVTGHPDGQTRTVSEDMELLRHEVHRLTAQQEFYGATPYINFLVGIM